MYPRTLRMCCFMSYFFLPFARRGLLRRQLFDVGTCFGKPGSEISGRGEAGRLNHDEARHSAARSEARTCEWGGKGFAFGGGPNAYQETSAGSAAEHVPVYEECDA